MPVGKGSPGKQKKVSGKLENLARRKRAQRNAAKEIQEKSPRPALPQATDSRDDEDPAAELAKYVEKKNTEQHFTRLVACCDTALGLLNDDSSIMDEPDIPEELREAVTNLSNQSQEHAVEVKQKLEAHE
eukprot:gene22327-26933_t